MVADGLADRLYSTGVIAEAEHEEEQHVWLEGFLHMDTIGIVLVIYSKLAPSHIVQCSHVYGINGWVVP